MENIVEGIRSRFFRATDENVMEEDVQRKQQKTNSRKERKGHMEKQRSGSGGRGKVRRFFTSRPSYSSDDSSDIDAVVAAAALAVSTRLAADSSSSSPEVSPVSSRTRARGRMDPISEGSFSFGSRRHLDEGANSKALVPSTSMERRRPANPQAKDSMERRRPANPQAKDSMALVPVPSRKDSKTSDSGSSRWDKQMVPYRSHSFDDREGSNRASRASSGKAREEKESNRHRASSEVEEKASAWLEDQLDQIDSSKKNSVIQEWEEKRRNEVNMIFQEIERRLNEKRAKAFEQLQIELERVHNKAERKKAKLNGKKETEMAVVIHKADKIRRSGRMSTNCCS
ncbi:uncharacterized protein LOC131078381 isoform X3 [Cryptomeria japonica]|uniref:uncharacterized protein LOC131078381 isoform X3 n=1 Tax=Cryptomeria japonica TaxID=3369 RepID=UPI0027DA5A62|nr:uncharacterized protein LOC131078381 isoform X3 [Cryptomeria japonica]